MPGVALPNMSVETSQLCLLLGKYFWEREIITIIRPNPRMVAATAERAITQLV